ncbi:hypothetical protein J5N97_003179 [Dioscorea zingiberensis]|uniref:Protein SQS1 n=1 Tax=Dioscorea zingiberensis TaxID=325984 RepID=A0A9D5D479_9LILI|nr:hypothetical protein J5N97_003179 [Dioscorea zingiberensis]
MGRNRNKGCGSRTRSVSSQSPKPNPTKRPNSYSAGGFVDGGVLIGWQHNSSGGKPRRKGKDFKPRGNAFAFTYPNDADADDAPRIAVVEPRSSIEIPVDGPRSELGFHGRDDVDEKEDVREGEFGEESVGFDPRLNQERKHKKMNEGFLSIGGLRLYTEDVSSPDEASDDLMDEDKDDEDDEDDEDEDEDEDEEDSGGESTEEEDGEEDGGSLEDDGLSSSIDSDDSDIDDEVVEDYLEGIGGSAALLGSEWLAGRSLEEYDEDGLLKSSTSGDEGGGKMSGFALMHASMEYGMKKKANARTRKGSAKKNVDVSPVVDAELSALDDVLLMKDARRRSAGRKKLVSSQVSRSWPVDAQMSKKYKNVMGGKKKHRKELIAVKRRERMINRGVDLDEINLKLRQMVVDELDTLSFVPMHSRDCTQVQRLASIYHLRSGCQGSGKKRFVIVTRTAHTSLPSATDRVRLDKLLGAGIEDEDFAVNEVKSKPQRLSKGKMKMSSKSPSSASHLRTGLQLSAPSKLSKHEASGNKKQASKRSSFSERPVSFVSCGVMQTDQVPEPVATNTSKIITNEMVMHSCPPKMGAFEVHTKGFGSKMMAKMGFVEGGGLGKDGQGMVQPIQPTKRPKSLGLGVEYAEKTTGVEYAEKTTGVKAQQVDFGSFEKHTQGFGSKMMVKMGFVPGTGLGKDGQGMTTPLSAVRLPKSRGLGAKS